MPLFRILLLTILLALPAGAQERSPLAGDVRLERAVTVRWKKATLSDALGELSRATGVRLTPERSLVDEPVMASATGTPARLFLEQIGKLLHLTWARSGGTLEKPGYLLYQDRRAKEEELAMLDGARRAVLAALEKEVDRYRRVSRLPPDEVAKQVEQSDQELAKAFENLASAASDPRMMQRMQDGQALRAAASPVGRALLDLLNGFDAGSWNLLQSEDPMVFSSRPEPGEARLPAGIQDRLSASKPASTFPMEIFRKMGPQIEQALGKVEEMMQQHWAKADGFKVTVQLNLNLGAQPVGMLRVTPEPMGGGEESIPALYMLSGLNLIGAPFVFDPAAEDPAEREKRLQADPVLAKKAVLKLPPLKPQPGLLAILGQAYRAAEILPNIEEAYGVRILADAYNRQAVSLFPPPGDQPIALYTVLDRLAGATRAWERDGDVIRLRSKTWAHDRRGEIPARHMRRWLAAREKKGGFTLDDLAEIAATLRDEQVESLIYSAMEEEAKDFQDFLMVTANRNILRFYATLLPLQRRLLESGKPLAGGSLYPYQARGLAGVNREANRSMFSFMGARPARRPDQLAHSQVLLERVDAAGRAAQPAVSPELGIGAPGLVYRLRIQYPDGQKDDHTIPISRPTRPGNESDAPPRK